jgi:hypothetical protein
MNKKMLQYIIAFILIFAFALGINQYLHTQEKTIFTKALEKIKANKPSLALTACTGTGLACAAIGQLFPYGTPATALLMRRYLLTSTAAQISGGTAVTLQSSLKNDHSSLLATAGFTAWGLKNLGWVEYLRRLPYDDIARAGALKRVATFIILTQALGTVGKYYAVPAFCALKQKVGDYTGTLPPEQLEDTFACLPWTE